MSRPPDAPANSVPSLTTYNLAAGCSVGFDFKTRELVKRQATLRTFAEGMQTSSFCLAPHGMHGGCGHGCHEHSALCPPSLICGRPTACYDWRFAGGGAGGNMRSWQVRDQALRAHVLPTVTDQRVLNASVPSPTLSFHAQGCIPVIFDHPHVAHWYPFEHLFPRETYAVVLNYSQARALTAHCMWIGWVGPGTCESCATVSR